MERIRTKTICLFMFICAIVGATDGATAEVIDVEGLESLKTPKCMPVELLVDLPIIENTSEELSSSHTFVKRCVGVNDEKKACITKDPAPLKIEHWSVTKVITGSTKKEAIHVSWVSHETCRYTKRTCPIEEARKCHEKSMTHYYDEVNCTCLCIVQIDGEETCKAIIQNPPSYSASTTVIWLPILSFILGMVVCALFLFLKAHRNGQQKKYSNVNTSNGHNETGVSTAASQIGFDHGGIEHPADPPTPTAEKTDQIGFNV